MASAPPISIPTAPDLLHLFESNMAELVSKIELHISCQNLRDRDILSKSDPMVVLFSEQRVNDDIVWNELDRTEVIKDNLNPSFVKSFIIEYHFERHQKLKFEVYDSDSTSRKLSCHDYLGYVVVTLGSIIGECGGKVTKLLLGKDHKKMTNSSISFVAEELCNNKEMMTMHFKARKLHKKHFLGQPHPFLVFSRQGIENDNFVAVHKTEIIRNNSNPMWKSFNIPVTSLCNGDKHRPVKIECYDYNSDGSHSLIGDLSFTVDELIKETNFSKQLIHPKKRKKKKYINSGWLDLLSIQLKNEASFLEYIFGGIELCVHVAIDFTASNGNPLQPSSLHFINDHSHNKYVQALTAIGQVCEDYDSDKMIPAYGFGAKINGHVYHDFHLNQKDDPHCYGISGVLDAYEKVIPNVELYGPTNFAPVINLVMKMANVQKTKKKYHILLILTDGAITDFDQTVHAIIKASFLPISIIIVGIGEADFTVMDKLDCDKEMLTYEGQTAQRDIVQFVPFHKFSGSFAAEDLAREVLFEVPNQLVEFMTQYNVKPQVSTFLPQRTSLSNTVLRQQNNLPMQRTIQNKRLLYQQNSLPTQISIQNKICSMPRQNSLPIENKRLPENDISNYTSYGETPIIPPYYNNNTVHVSNNNRDSTISAKEYALQTLAQYTNL